MGELSDGSTRYALYLENNTDTLDELRNFPIISNRENKVYLQDIATLSSGPRDITKYYHFADTH